MKPSARRVLTLLRIFPSITQLDCLREGAGFRLAARVGELRAEGYVITCDKSEGFGRYTLQEEGADCDAALTADPRAEVGQG